MITDQRERERDLEGVLMATELAEVFSAAKEIVFSDGSAFHDEMIQRLRHCPSRETQLRQLLVHLSLP